MKPAEKPAAPKKMAHEREREVKPKKPHNPANNLGKFLHPAKKKK
jgi:hypothetical protein